MSADQASIASTNEQRLAFVEGFLLMLARRLDDVGYNWPKASEAADDCRRVAKMVAQVGVPMDRPPPATETSK